MIMALAPTTPTLPGVTPFAVNGTPSPIPAASSLNQGDFLKLLVAQLSSQDPLQPVSNTDFLAQMAQFSTLQQTQTMQTNLAGIQAGQALLQANSLLGRMVQVQAGPNQTAIGVVSAVGMQAGKPTLLINGQTYDLSQVLSVSAAPTAK